MKETIGHGSVWPSTEFPLSNKVNIIIKLSKFLNLGYFRKHNCYELLLVLIIRVARRETLRYFESPASNR